MKVTHSPLINLRSSVFGLHLNDCYRIVMKSTKWIKYIDSIADNDMKQRFIHTA